MKRLSVLLLLSITSMTTSAAIYKWVDENGNTNYGQKIPAQYKNKSKSINATISIIDSVPVKKKNKNMLNPYGNENHTLTNKKRMYSPNKTKRNASCSAKKAAYKRSLNCFKNCSTPAANNRGKNISRCKCRNMTKPSC